MNRDQIERMRMKLKLGQPLDPDECERLLDEIDELRAHVAHLNMFAQFDLAQMNAGVE